MSVQDDKSHILDSLRYGGEWEKSLILRHDGTCLVRVTRSIDFLASEEVNLGSLIGCLNAIRVSIPQEHRATAVVEFNTYYESLYVGGSVSYVRPLTEDELRVNESEREEQRKKEEERERAELSRLVAKYHPK
jgi:hypothetical protein